MGECLGIFFLGVVKSSKSINYLIYTWVQAALVLQVVMDTRCPRTTWRKILWVFCVLECWWCELARFYSKERLGEKQKEKKEKKGDNFGNFIRFFGLILILKTTDRRWCLGNKICKGAISNDNVHKRLNPIFGEQMSTQCLDV